MTKAYLGVWAADGHLNVEVTSEPSRVLTRAHGLSSPVFPALLSTPAARLAQAGAILFIVSASPTSTLAKVINDMTDEVSERVYLSHGHASVILFMDTKEECETVVAHLGGLVSAHEIWEHSDGRVLDRITVEPTMSDGWAHPAEIDARSLSLEARAQVAQFNANIAMLSRVASLYAPETHPLVESLHASIADIVDQLHTTAQLPDTQRLSVSRSLEGVLVEANAVVTLYCSQLGSGTLPLSADTFPVGEYSLLGIGGMSRSAWRIYSHLNNTFATHDHIGVVKRVFPKTVGFDPYAPSGRMDYTAWRELNSSVRDLTDNFHGQYQQHVPYFSSRWGFHEAMHSISMSWQCLYASASRQWNLLTMTHEYLHAHVRGFFSHVLQPGDEDIADRLCRMHAAREKGSSTLESLQIAYVEALVGLESVEAIAAQIHGGDQTLGEFIPGTLDRRTLELLNRRHANLIHEIVVHVLDFRYVYDGRDDVYVDSVWSSWAQVPSVAGRIDHYVLRTLCSLASTTNLSRSPEIFDDVVERLRKEISVLQERASSGPVIGAALALLSDDASLKRLRVEFMGARYVVELARSFFFDNLLNAELVRDDLTTVVNGQRTYGVQVGEYRGEKITSPIGFLLDMFDQYPVELDSETLEHASIWQMLQLI